MWGVNLNNKKKIYLTTIALGTISTGLVYYNLKYNINLDNTSSIYSTELLNTIEKDTILKYNNIVRDYNLGDVVLGEKNESIKVSLKGTIGVPQKINNAPIIFIMSGNNNSSLSNNLSNNSYEGLKYLVDSLSKSGYLTLLINTDLALDENKENYIVEDKILSLIFEKHSKYLKDSISGKNNRYPISLYNKGDLNNVGLIGQSNTGRTIYNIVNQEILNGKDNIKGLLSVTPTGNSSILSYPDIPSSILSTEHSVSTNIGFDMYNDIEKTVDRKSFSQLTYLIGGNSIKFNSSIEYNTDDNRNNSNDNSNNLERSSITINEDTIQDELTHQKFLSYYTIDFFDYIFKRNTDNCLYDNRYATAQKIYKKDILSKLFTSNRREIINANNINSLDAKFNNIKYKNVIESSITSLDTAIDFNEPSTNIELPLLQLDWKSSNPSIDLPVNNGNTDFSQFNSLSIEWALNHSSDLSNTDIEKVSIILEDNHSKSEVILLDELPLNKIVGTSETILKENKITSNWSRYTPIGETRIPLNLFKGIDLTNIKKISIQFGDNKTGSIFLKGMHLNK